MNRITKKVEDGLYAPDWESFMKETGAENCDHQELTFRAIQKLGMYEDLESQGRLLIKAAPITGTCGTCQHFKRNEPGKSSGICAVRKHKDHYGHVIGETHHVTQGHKACRSDYKALSAE